MVESRLFVSAILNSLDMRHSHDLLSAFKSSYYAMLQFFPEQPIMIKLSSAQLHVNIIESVWELHMYSNSVSCIALYRSSFDRTIGIYSVDVRKYKILYDMSVLTCTCMCT